MHESCGALHIYFAPSVVLIPVALALASWCRVAEVMLPGGSVYRIQLSQGIQLYAIHERVSIKSTAIT